MSGVDGDLLTALAHVVGSQGVVTDPKRLEVLSRDHFWFSPVLTPLLTGKRAEAAVIPRTVDELVAVVALAARERVPITMRGSGTGNYGQGVPLKGGLLLSTVGLRGILQLTPERATVQAGVKLGVLEREARRLGAELRMYPSTYLTATAGGFLAGGAGGVGSVTWGTLWDEGNVLGTTVVTVEEAPRVVEVTGAEDLLGVIHSCGLTGVIADLTLALAPARPWAQFAAAFPDFESAFHFGASLAYDEGVPKRLVSLHEWPLPSFFPRLVQAGVVREGRALVLLELDLNPHELERRALEHGGDVTFYGPPETYHRGGLPLSDFSWNHTTLWAIKADPGLTYLQDAYDPARALEQYRTRKARFGGDLLAHIEFMRTRGRVIPQGMSVVRFRDKAYLGEMITFTESLGMRVADPHTHKLDEDSRWNGLPVLSAKRRWDPFGLLNPGHLNAWEDDGTPPR